MNTCIEHLRRQARRPLATLPDVPDLADRDALAGRNPRWPAREPMAPPEVAEAHSRSRHAGSRPERGPDGPRSIARRRDGLPCPITERASGRRDERGRSSVFVRDWQDAVVRLARRRAEAGLQPVADPDRAGRVVDLERPGPRRGRLATDRGHRASCCESRPDSHRPQGGDPHSRALWTRARQRQRLARGPGRAVHRHVGTNRRRRSTSRRAQPLDRGSGGGRREAPSSRSRPQDRQRVDRSGRGSLRRHLASRDG
jgi:hypothetical protein